MALDVKQAVTVATKYLTELFPSAIDIRLEEVDTIEPTPSAYEQWEITLSYELATDAATMPPTGTMSELYRAAGVSLRRPRYFRVFRIESDSGKVRSMKMRQGK